MRTSRPTCDGCACPSLSLPTNERCSVSPPLPPPAGTAERCRACEEELQRSTVYYQRTSPCCSGLLAADSAAAAAAGGVDRSSTVDVASTLYFNYLKIPRPRSCSGGGAASTTDCETQLSPIYFRNVSSSPTYKCKNSRLYASLSSTMATRSVDDSSSFVPLQNDSTWKFDATAAASRKKRRRTGGGSGGKGGGGLCCCCPRSWKISERNRPDSVGGSHAGGDGLMGENIEKDDGCKLRTIYDVKDVVGVPPVRSPSSVSRKVERRRIFLIVGTLLALFVLCSVLMAGLLIMLWPLTGGTGELFIFTVGVPIVHWYSQVPAFGRL